MSDRLDHLRRQQALLKEHLDWIEREIAAEQGSPDSPLPLAAPSAPTPVAPPPAPEPEINVSALLAAATKELEAPAPLPPEKAAAMAAADEIIARYQAEDVSRPEDLKRGCLLTVAALIALLFLGFVVIAKVFYSGAE